MFLHQRTYLEHVIEKFGINDAKIVSVPADPHVRLRPVDTEEVNRSKISFRKAVGSLMFLAIVSRPDIAYSVNAFSKYLNNYDESHWLAVKRIVKYLKGTLDLGIRYGSGKSLLQVVGYSDADYANDIETRRSTTGYVFMLVNGPVTWSSQRQKLVTLSTTEAKYVAAASAAKEMIWLRKLLSDIGHGCSEATVLFIDNQSAIRLVKNPEFHKRTKHIAIRFHIIPQWARRQGKVAKIQDFVGFS
ncbi:integrase core domain protein [Lasius niger]|uniref:Integrase core domain protein n=1 Tax=Lasius niger TaxID=67767 RepID=A0A0J7K4U5_LASNI|nr:integrase core domain protein [Lasius niger]